MRNELWAMRYSPFPNRRERGISHSSFWGRQQQFQNVMCKPTRSRRPITIADGRPSDEPMVVTALVTALVLKILYTSRVGSIFTFSIETIFTNRRSTRLTHGYR